MPALNWGMVQDGGVFESLMHAILYAEDPGTILFGRPGKDAGQDARSVDGSIVYQAKYRQRLVMDGAIDLALEELEKVKAYRQPQHANYIHWQHAKCWVLVANFSINPNDDTKWQASVVPAYQQQGLLAEYLGIEGLEGKLAAQAHVRDVFFGGENRVLVGLKEAHDLLSAECVGSSSFDTPLVGRDDAIKTIKAFAASNDKRLLPVVGPCGIGKSRLLYESLMSLAQDGWRVFWALPGTMSKSSHWFRLLNGAQQTCVAIDDPDDPGLLRQVVEQLATVERRNWRVLFACRTEKSEALRRFRTHKMVEEAIQLGPLDEPASKNLLEACVGGHRSEAWLHSVCKHTERFPAWMCLIAELARRDSLTNQLPQKADEIATAYVESCLKSLGGMRDQSLTLLRWIALWGVLISDVANDQQPQFRFLEELGIPKGSMRDLLRALVKSGLVHNWGIGERIHAVKPLIIRQQLLSSWLLSEDNGRYQVSADGKRIIDQLVKGEVPAVDLVLGTLSHLTQSRLAEPDAGSFLKPIFSAMATIARDGDVWDQHRVAELVEKVGAADPESALEVFITIWKNVKPSRDVNSPPWGTHTFTHDSLVANLPWAMFQIAECVSDQIVARRYLGAFRELLALERGDELSTGSGKGSRQLLKRLLCESRNSDVYAQPAYDIVAAEIASSTAWPFVAFLIECLLNPMRERMEVVANWTLAISRHAFVPGSSDWNLAAGLRARAFNYLQTDREQDIRTGLWRVLSEAHQEFHRAILHGNVKPTHIAQYRSVLIDDLKKCGAILQAPPVALSIEEATSARGIWSWYLTYGEDADLVVFARQCEQIYNGFSKWRLQDFFSFGTDENLAPETARIAGLLKSASSLETVTEFFTEAKKYLDAARRSGQGMADSWRIRDLADACTGLLSLDVEPPVNALTSFVVSVLGQADNNPLAWMFASRVCQNHILHVKQAGNEEPVEKELARLLDLSVEKARLLYTMYSNLHPTSTGILTRSELDCILRFEREFSKQQSSVLLGGFTVVSWESIEPSFHQRLNSLRGKPEDASEVMALFIRFSWLATLRYDRTPSKLLVAFIVDRIIDLDLDGSLLANHDLTRIREKAGFKLSMRKWVELVRSRLHLEQQPTKGHHFQILPDQFDILGWVQFDETNSAEVADFDAFCALALEPTFTAIYWLPKYISRLDLSGRNVAAFVGRQLDRNPEINTDDLSRLGYLASAYVDSSDAWATIALPICSKAQTLPREGREHVYFSLARKETGVLRSMPGEVPEYYIKLRDTAAQMRESTPTNSPLMLYREWALLRAEEDIRQAQGRAEEDANG